MENKVEEEQLIPICSHCLRIRPGTGDPWEIESWEKVDESKLALRLEHFSHGICPDCLKEFYGDFYKEGVA